MLSESEYYQYNKDNMINLQVNKYNHVLVNFDTELDTNANDNKTPIVLLIIEVEIA